MYAFGLIFDKQKFKNESWGGREAEFCWFLKKSCALDEHTGEDWSTQPFAPNLVLKFASARGAKVETGPSPLKSAGGPGTSRAVRYLQYPQLITNDF